MIEAEIKPFSGIDKYTIHKTLEEIIKEFGLPEFDVPIIFHGKIFLLKYDQQGFIYWFSTEDDKYPFAIEITKKIGGRIDGKQLFGKNAKYIIDEYLLNANYNFWVDPNGSIKVKEIGMTLGFSQDNLKEASVLRHVLIHKMGWLYYSERLLEENHKIIDYKYIQKLKDKYIGKFG